MLIAEESTQSGSAQSRDQLWCASGICHRSSSPSELGPLCHHARLRAASIRRSPILAPARLHLLVRFIPGFAA